MRIYLDNAATTKMSDTAIKAMIPYMNYRPRTLQEIIALEKCETRCNEGALLK